MQMVTSMDKDLQHTGHNSSSSRAMFCAWAIAGALLLILGMADYLVTGRMPDMAALLSQSIDLH